MKGRAQAVVAWARDKKGRVLVVAHTRGLELPGGHVEVGETHLQALEREVWEETGSYVEQVGDLLLTKSDEKGDVYIYECTATLVLHSRDQTAEPNIHAVMAVPVEVAAKWFPDVYEAVKSKEE